MGARFLDVWVTSAVTEEEAKACLVLRESFRQTWSGKEALVLVSSKLSDPFKNLLWAEFSHVIILEETWNRGNLSEGQFAKIYALNLKRFERCIYLDPFSLIVKNCDHLFSLLDEDNQLLLGGELIFGLKPAAFDLVKAIHLWRDEDIGLGEILKLASLKDDLGYRFIDQEFTTRLPITEGLTTGIYIVNLKDEEGDMIVNQGRGELEKSIIGMWKGIFSKNETKFLATSPNYFPTQGRQLKEPIAIVGISCRYPGSENLDQFWDLLVRGEILTGKPPQGRWASKGGEINASYLSHPVDQFDGDFFGISRKELDHLDPQHRLLLEVVWEGVENAGMTLEELEGKHGGVFLGSWTNDFKSILARSGRTGFYRNYMGNSIGAATARISSFLGLTGPSISTESGCSSAMVGVHLACRSLWEGESEFALACGVNLLLEYYDESFLPTAVSPEGRCKTFDARADGFGRAEGCGVLVLKKLSDAVRANDNIWAVIRGSGIAQEGVSPSLGTPTDHCEALAMKNALIDAGVQPNEVSYVEAHGTGTVVGDPIEMSAIAKAYSRERKEPLVVGSVKTNIGHTESCSGITGITKVALALLHEVIPQHQNFESLNPAVNLKAVPAILPLQPVEWKKTSGKRRLAGVSSFGITGTDTHLIMEEAPEVHSFQLGPLLSRGKHLLSVSAKNGKALEILLEKYKSLLKATPEAFPDIAYSANVGRTSFTHRAVLIAHDNEDAVLALEKGNEMRGEVTQSHGKVCFLFTGQGSQYHGMAKELYDTSPVFRTHFNYCEHLLQEKYNINISSVIWSQQESPQVKQTVYSQTSIFCVEYALMKLWESWGLKPDYVLGHSLGEFCAAVCAGILTVEDALHLVAHRSLLIDRLPHGKMLVVRADQPKVEQLLEEYSKNTGEEAGLDFAALNSPEQTVLAGDAKLILGFADLCKAKGVKNIVLESTHAFHSKHMDSMLAEYKCIADKISLGKGLSSQYISGLEGTLTSPSKMNSKYWVRHTREKVHFIKAAHTAVKLGCTTFIEIGPQPLLSAMTLLNCEDSQITCLPSLKKTEGNWSTLLHTLGKLYLEGVSINWKGFDGLYPRRKVHLPNYPFLRKRCWPEGLVPEENSSHPLLGAKIPNATSSKLFQCGVTLDNLEYLKDHKLGANVIFPGAAYIEMGLAAGHQVASGGSYSTLLTIKDVCILVPLALSESEAVQIQTVVQLEDSPASDEDEGGFKLRFCSKANSTADDPWRDHATARFIPSSATSSFADGFPNVATFLEAISTPGDVAIASEIRSTTGQHFGPSFTSLQEGWKLNENFILKVKVPSPDDKYIVHPVLIDAMLQSYSLIASPNKSGKKGVIYMPVSVGLFRWLGKSSSSSERYIWASPSSIYLLDGDFTQLAVMSGLEAVETSLTALEAVLLEKKKPLPDLWEEVWVETCGLMENRVNLSSHLCPSLRSDMIPLEQDSDKMSAIEQLQKRLYYHMLKCLYDCGWRQGSQSKEKFDEEELFAQLGIQPKFHKYVGVFLQVFESEGVLQKEEKSWKVSNQLPSYSQVEAYLDSDATHLLSQFPSYSLVQHLSSKLPAILSGLISPHDVLFSTSNKEGDSSMEKLYQHFFSLFQMNDSVNDGIFRLLDSWLQKSEQDFTLRICEVGAGTGLSTKLLTDQLEKHGVNFEYTFTDISPAFFPSAEKKFERFGEKMIFRKLNIEEDPIGQGFIPEYYDYLLAHDVLHTTKDIKDTITKAKTLLRPGGFFQILEQLRIDRLLSFIFGSFEGYWNFKDFHLRSHHALLNKSQWRDLLTSEGFLINEVIPCGFSHEALITVQKEFSKKGRLPSGENCPVWIVYHVGINLAHGLERKLENTGRKVIVVQSGENFQEMDQGCRYTLREDKLQDFEAVVKSLKERKHVLEGVLYLWPLDRQRISQEKLLQPLFNLTKRILHLDQKSAPKLVALTKATLPVGSNDLSDNFSNTISGFMKSAKHESSELACRTIAIPDFEDINLEQEVFYQLWKSQEAVQLVLHNGKDYYPKLISHKPKLSELPLELPFGTSRFLLMLPESKYIQDLKFGPLESFDLKEDEVEIKVKSCGLNFRDIFSVLKPSQEFQNINTIGTDFAGEIRRVGGEVTKWKVGDVVFGENLCGEAFPSHIKKSAIDCFQVPPEMTLAEAATLPSVFITVYECLVKVAQLRSSDVILIHTASGGVGLCAVQIATSIGAKIIATVGSSRKEKYLRALGIENVFNSRSTNYSKEILKVTDGHGVTVVLNSLTSPGFKEATLKASARGARFVEMSKLDIWTREEVKLLRPDVEYRVVDVASLSRDERRTIMIQLEKFLESKVISPLPYVSFQGVHIRQALEYLQKGKHIGKVVVRLAEGKEVENVSSTFNSRSSYLITGGLGGIGFQVAKWMLSCGAKHVLLAGRSCPGSEILNEIDRLNSTGGNLIPVQVDVSDISKLKELLDSLPTLKLPPLRGVMHSASTLFDGLVSNQKCWKSFSSTFKAKLDGTLNLHELTKHLNLEHFVLFSTMASSFGTPGQSNHAAGNSFLDAFAHYRESIGLPVTSINWGPWSEIGAAKDLDFPGVIHISPSQGMAALHYILHSQKSRMSVINISSPILLTKFLPMAASYMEKSVFESGSNVTESCNDTNSEHFWTDYNSQQEAQGRISILQRYVCKILQKILKLEKTDEISSTALFQQMGVDSLMFVEIRNLLQAMLGKKVELSIGALRNNNSVSKLTLLLWNLIEETGEDSSIPSLDQVNNLIRQDCHLDISISAGDRKAKKISDVKCVLLTGVTGTLGPYILAELSRLPQVSKIFCLVRTRNGKSGEERMHHVLEKHDLASSVNRKIVHCIEGDVALEKLGLGDTIWSNIVAEVDAIIHPAAKVDYTEYYGKNDLQNDTRAVNVEGTKNILKLASSGQGHVKQVYFASTLLAVTGDGEDSLLTDKWPEAGDFDDITIFAYPISKHVGDVLAKQAVDRGIPCKVFRFPIISGHSKSGRFDDDQGHLVIRYLYFLKTGFYPKDSMPLQILPADVCAKASLEVFFDDKAPSDLYNIFHPENGLDMEFVELAEKLGYPVKLVEFQEFSQYLRRDKENSPYHIFREFHTLQDYYIKHVFRSPGWLARKKDYFKSDKLAKLIPNLFDGIEPAVKYIEKDLLFAKEQGWFPKLGLDTN